MAIVERGNVVLEVPEDAIQHFIDKGYNLTNGHGQILQRAVPNEVGELRKLLIEKESEINVLKAEIEDLKNKFNQEEEIEVEVEKKRKRGRPRRLED